MYKKACKEALNYIRPIIIGKKYYNNDTIINDIGTVIVLNKNQLNWTIIKKLIEEYK